MTTPVLTEEHRRIFWESCVNRAIQARQATYTAADILKEAEVFYNGLINPPKFVTDPIVARDMGKSSIITAG